MGGGLARQNSFSHSFSSSSSSPTSARAAVASAKNSLLQQQYDEEIARLRNEFRNKLPITLDHKYVFVLFCPPEYPIDTTANYLSSRLCLPSVSFNQETILDDFLNELKTNESYKNGCIISRYPVNMPDVANLKRQLENENGKLYLLYFDVDAQTFQAAVKKFDRYIHPSSNRSYHLSETPPQSFLTDARKLLDDLTGEKLVQLPGDTIEGYRERLKKYHEQHLPLFINFFNIARIIEGGGSLEGSHQLLDQTIYKIISANILEKMKKGTPNCKIYITAKSLSSDFDH